MKTLLKFFLAANVLLQISLANEEVNQENPGTTKNPEETSPSQEPTTVVNQENPDTTKNPEETSPSQEPTTKTATESNEDNYIYKDDIVPCGSVSTLITKVQERIVNCHNDHRRNVVPPAANMLKLKWNATLAELAQKWADKCFLNHSRPEDRYIGGYPYGENVVVSPACVSWELAIKQWKNEEENLEFGVGAKDNKTTGHYTQIVNFSTFQMGCGMNPCENGTQAFYVCKYFFAGNNPERLFKPYDPGEPCSACKEHCDDSKKLCLNPCENPDRAGNCKMIMSYDACNNYSSDCYASCSCKDKIK